MRVKSAPPADEYVNPMTQLRAALNGAKVLSPLLSAVFQTPGLASDPQTLSDAIGQIGALHQQTTKLVSDALLPGDTHPAKKATIATALAHLVGQAWTKDSKNIDPQTISRMFIQTLELSTPLPDQAFDDQFPRITSEALSEARATADILPTLLRVEAMGGLKKLFWGGHTLESATGLAKADLQGRARAMAEKLLPPNAGEEQASIAYRSVLKTSTPVFAQVLSTEFNQLGRQLQAITALKPGKNDPPEQAKLMEAKYKEQQTKYLEQAAQLPQGVLLARVAIQMDKAMSVLFPSASLAMIQKTNSDSAPAHAEEEESQHAPA